LHQLAGHGLERDFPILRTPRRRHPSLRLTSSALIGPEGGRAPIAASHYH
jgi:hypothetical protein